MVGITRSKVIFLVFLWNRARAIVRSHAPFFAVLCIFLSTTFADRGPKPRKQRPYLGDDRNQVARKTGGFVPERLFKPEFTRSRPVTLHTYLKYLQILLDDDDDDNIPVGGPWLKTIGRSLMFFASRNGLKTYPASYQYIYMISSAPGFQLFGTFLSYILGSLGFRPRTWWLWKITVLWWPRFFAFRGHLVQNVVPRFSTPDDARIELAYISHITDLIKIRKKDWNRMRERCWKFAR